MTFARFMELCLYDPEQGYYRRESKIFGPEGDFYTSPCTHPVFARILGDALASYLSCIGGAETLDLVEMGAGEGTLGEGVVARLQDRHPRIFERIRYRAQEVGDTNLPDRIQGVVFSNELFDALPVHRIRVSRSELKEIYVRLDDPITEVEGDLSNPRILDYMRLGFPQWREGYVYEANLRMVEILEDLNRRFVQGFVLTLDYGFEAPEYEAMDRRDGTLLCYHRHRVHSDAYVNLGRQDLTSHVNFRVFRETAAGLGWTNRPLRSQREFLTRWGLEARLLEEEKMGFLEPSRLKDRLGLKTLLTPGGISDTLKVQVQEVGAGRKRS
jgi:SAM-dependent MidA family methyltransferase